MQAKQRLRPGFDASDREQAPIPIASQGQGTAALPYGEQTDWLKNVLANGSAAVVTNGRIYDVGQPEVIPIAEVTDFFRTERARHAPALPRRLCTPIASHLTETPHPRTVTGGDGERHGSFGVVSEQRSKSAITASGPGGLGRWAGVLWGVVSPGGAAEPVDIAPIRGLPCGPPS